VHPGWQDTNVIAQAAPNDIGILRLQQAPNVAPSPISTSAPHTGQMITLVGYGVTDFDKKDAKVKRVAVASVDAVYPGYIKYGGYNGAPEGAHRAGDSGGPSFASTGGQEAVIAVHSIGNKPTGLVFDCRVDRHVAWIKQQAGGDVVVAGAGSQPSNPGAPGLSGLLGQPCQNHGECKALVCGSLGGQARCTIPCTTGAFCRVGSKCYATQIPNVGMCWPPTGGQAPNTTPPTGAPQKTPYGQPCAQNGDCQSSLCADVNGKKFCTMACGSGSWVVCPLTSICLPTQIPGLSACVPTL
jgi:hypothetical protein